MKPGVFLAVAVVVALALPFFAGSYALSFMVQTFIFICLAYSWNLIGGYAGYTHFGQVAFFGLGAYAGTLAIAAGVHWLLAALAAGLSSALCALILGGVFLLYFLCIGAGYILIQVAMIQKFVLLLGHPTYALIVIVFAMLVASSLGSYCSKRLGAADRDGVLRWVLVTIAALVALLSLVITPILDAAVGWPFAARVALTLALIAPPAFAMGMPFPSGLARLERWHKASVRWASRACRLLWVRLSVCPDRACRRPFSLRAYRRPSFRPASWGRPFQISCRQRRCRHPSYPV